MTDSLKNKSILLVISGGIAAYKSLELIRLIKKAGGSLRCILTKGGSQFVTPLSVSALAEDTVYDDLWSLKDESEMGHIRLTREADLIVIAPASANLIAQMAYGLAEDLASTTLLATDDETPILLAPAMNLAMWNNAATQDNIAALESRGIKRIGPDEGNMACGEHGPGRMSEPETIFAAIENHFAAKPLAGKTAIVTSGPTFEPLDPVRFIGNRSSGKQGHAIAAALAEQGADVTLITGPVCIPNPTGVKTTAIETANEMLKSCEDNLPADIAICAAAVSDWASADYQNQKIKKQSDKDIPDLKLVQNPDILKTIAGLPRHSSKGTKASRPTLVIGFAAETEDLQNNATAKRLKKGCDWILANDVSENVFGTDQNQVYLIDASDTQEWPTMSKTAVAERLTQEIIEHFKTENTQQEAAE